MTFPTLPRGDTELTSYSPALRAPRPNFLPCSSAKSPHSKSSRISMNCSPLLPFPQAETQFGITPYLALLTLHHHHNESVPVLAKCIQARYNKALSNSRRRLMPPLRRQLPRTQKTPLNQHPPRNLGPYLHICLRLASTSALPVRSLILAKKLRRSWIAYVRKLHASRPECRLSWMRINSRPRRVLSN